MPGVSLAIFHKGDLTTAAAGVINVTTGVEVTADTVMHIGSITKVLNATLVMQLVDEGAIELDERVVRYLPDLRLKDHEALEQITVRMLLNHTSGIDGEGLPDYGHDEETLEKGIARYAELGQIHRPGAECSYCNVGTVIGGYLAQHMKGKSWYGLVRERIFEPLKMEHAAALPEEALLHRASVGHFLSTPPDQKLIRSSFAFLPLSLGPAGSTLMMSARDLIAFARAHIGNGLGANGVRILSERSAKAMQQKTVNNKGKGYTYADGIGIGWIIYENGLLNHFGGGPGIASALYAYPEGGFAAAILTNAEHGMSVINEVMELWFKEVGITKPFDIADIRIPSEPVKIDANKYVGVYENIMYRYRISRTRSGVELSKQAKFAEYDSISTEATPPARLIPLGDENFILEPDAETLTGLHDPRGRIFAFLNPGADGRMQHLGNFLRLYRRAS